MATRVCAKANVERGVPVNPGTRMKHPYVVIDSKRDIKLAEKPASDEKRYVPCEINLYGP